MNRFVFGPVPSRRLGFSLGVDIIPKKVCTFDCIYCQVGRTTEKTALRSHFFDPDDVIGEILREAKGRHPIDFITFSGSGEPTLNKDLGLMIRTIKENISIPVAVITNGSLLGRDEVRQDLSAADLLVPSLDAVTDDVFQAVNRPSPALSTGEIIRGLKALRADFDGRIWLEIMLIQNVNDMPQHLELLAEIVAGLEVDKIQLNTTARPACEDSARAISSDRLATIQRLLGSRAEVICDFKREGVKGPQRTWAERTLATLARRSLTLEDIVATSGVSHDEALEGLKMLIDENKIIKRVVNRVVYYSATE